MHVLVVGGGGREHAIVWKLSRDAPPPEITCAPGNAGIAKLARALPLAADDVAGIVAWASEHRPDLTVIGPEAPLCLGLADALAALGLRVFGPCQSAARLEGSKAFSKEIMIAAGVPTPRACVCDCPEAARAALDRFGLPVVIKADGLAAGKGVIIAQTRKEAEDAIHGMLVEHQFGAAGAHLLIEEFLEGEEVSILALVDGRHAVLLPTSQDHKRARDGDQGPNTGGMGAYSPAPIVGPDALPVIRDTVILPVIRELARRGIVYRGILYAGLMIGADGIRVLEFNVRFGDPETQAVLPRLNGNLLPILMACADGALRDDHVSIKPEAAATVVMAAAGYPGDYARGAPISGLEEAEAQSGCAVFHAGTTRTSDNQVVASGGRVLSVTALGADLATAVARAYAGVSHIRFEGAHYRRDIAARALQPPSPLFPRATAPRGAP